MRAYHDTNGSLAAYPIPGCAAADPSVTGREGGLHEPSGQRQWAIRRLDPPEQADPVVGIGPVGQRATVGPLAAAHPSRSIELRLEPVPQPPDAAADQAAMG